MASQARVVGSTVSMIARTPQQLRDMARLLEDAGVGKHEAIPANAQPTLRITTRERMELGPLIEFGLLM